MACLTSVWSISLVTGLPKVGYFLIKKHPLPAKSAMCWIQELIHFAHSPMFPWHSEQSLAQSSCFIKTLDHVWNCGDKNHPSCSQEPQSPLWGEMGYRRLWQKRLTPSLKCGGTKGNSSGPTKQQPCWIDGWELSLLSMELFYWLWNWNKLQPFMFISIPTTQKKRLNLRRVYEFLLSLRLE